MVVRGLFWLPSTGGREIHKHRKVLCIKQTQNGCFAQQNRWIIHFSQNCYVHIQQKPYLNKSRLQNLLRLHKVKPLIISHLYLRFTDNFRQLYYPQKVRMSAAGTWLEFNFETAIKAWLPTIALDHLSIASPTVTAQIVKVYQSISDYFNIILSLLHGLWYHPSSPYCMANRGSRKFTNQPALSRSLCTCSIASIASTITDFIDAT